MRSISRWTFMWVARLMRGLSLRTIETVATETLAILATSRRLTGLPARPMCGAERGEESPPEAPPPAGRPRFRARGVSLARDCGFTSVVINVATLAGSPLLNQFTNAVNG